MMKTFLVGLTAFSTILAPLFSDDTTSSQSSSPTATQSSTSTAAPEANTSTAPGQPETFVSEKHGYSITFPADWKTQKDFRNLDVIALAPSTKDQASSHANISVMAIKSDTDINLNDLTDSTVENLKKIFKEIDLVDNSKISVNGLDGKKLTYNYSFGEIKLQVQQYFFLKNQTAYIITCTTLLKEVPNFASVFEQAVNSFKLQ